MKNSVSIRAFISLLVFTSTIVYGDIIEWGTSGQVLYDQTTETFLQGDSDDYTNGGFIQLLHIGTDGVYDATDVLNPGTNGDGTFGNDTVIAQSWVGDGELLTNGQFTASDNPANTGYTSGIDDFVIRVFDTPVSEADWTAGNIPTSGYHNYYLFENPDKEATGRYVLNIPTKLSTTLQVIPEPTVVMLLATMGLLLMSRRRPRRVSS